MNESCVLMDHPSGKLRDHLAPSGFPALVPCNSWVVKRTISLLNAFCGSKYFFTVSLYPFNGNALGVLIFDHVCFFTCIGDAMDIEDDDSNSNSNIYVNTPVVPPSTHPLSTLSRPTPLPHRSSLLSQFNQPVSLCFVVVCLFLSFLYFYVLTALETVSLVIFKPHLRALKKSARHAKFLAPCLVYPCRDYLRGGGVVSASLKF